MEAKEILLNGGIAPAKTPKIAGLSTSPLEAKTYAHRALVGRTIVRLTAEAVGAATDVEMGVLGFGAPTASHIVGQSLLRALGFPAWAVVHDPKHARFALEVMQEFRRAARRIRSKPGFARDDLVKIAKRLERSVPHFLPSFWEEAGRAFLAEGSRTFAAQSFEKARLAEKEFKLKVDEDQRSRAYLEFALAGAVATKSLAGYADDLTVAFGAKEAYRRFLDLAVQRTRGGIAPWATFAKDMRRLAKAAKIDAEAADREVLEALLDAPALGHAPLEFWSAYRPQLVRMAKSDPAVRAGVRHLFPRTGSQALINVWLEILEETGAIDAFVLGHGDAAGEPEGAAAKWLERLAAYVGDVGWRSTEAPLSPMVGALMAKVAPRAKKEGPPVDLATGTGYWRRYLTDILERALELGLELAPPRAKNAELRLDCSFELDPVRLAKHPVFRSMLTQAVAEVFGGAEFEERAKGKAGLVEARGAWLADAIDQLAKSGLPGLRIGLHVLAEKTSPAMFAEFPAAKAALDEVRPAASLQRTLAGGLLDELGWPAFEKAAAELMGPKVELELHGSTRHPILRAGTKVIVFDGAERAQDMTLPSKLKDIESLLYIGGQLLVFYRDASYQHQAAWSSDFKDAFQVKTALGVAPAVALLGDGSQTFGGRAIAPGDRSITEQGSIVDDGTTLFRAERKTWGEPIVCFELDPRTGQKGRASWPKFVEPGANQDDGLRMHSVRLLRAPPGAERSPLGQADGLVGWYVRQNHNEEERGIPLGEVVRVDGVKWSGAMIPWALLTVPASEEPRPVQVSTAYDASSTDSIEVFHGDQSVSRYGGADDDLEDDDAADSDLWAIQGFARMPRPAWLHFMRPRDERGSAALRSIDVETCEALLAACAGADAEDAKGLADAIVRERLATITDENLRRAVVRAVLTAHTLALRLEGLRDAAPGDRVEPLADEDLAKALPIQLRTGWNTGEVGGAIHSAGRWLLEGKKAALPGSTLNWEGVLPHFSRALAFLATRELTEESARAPLVRAVAIWASSPFASGARLRLATVEAAEDAPILAGVKNAGGAPKLHAEGTSRYVVRRSGDYYDDDDTSLQILEAFEGSEPRLPAQTTLEKSEIIDLPDERAFLQGVLAKLEERGPVPFDVADAEALAAASGMDLARAKLLVAGLPNFATYLNDFLGKARRERLDVKLGDAKNAKSALVEADRTAVYAALASALAALASPDELYDRSAKDAPARWVASMARSSKQEAAVELRRELVEEVRRYLSWGAKPEAMLAPLLDPGSPWLRYKPSSLRQAGDRNSEHLTPALVDAFATMAVHLALTLPAGDPYREGLPKAYDVIRGELMKKDTILPLCTLYLDKPERRDSIIEKFGSERIDLDLGGKDKQEGRDNGAGILVPNGRSLEVLYRPSTLFAPAMQGAWAIVLASLAEASDVGAQTVDMLRCVRCLLSDPFARAMQRIASGTVPEGKYDADPRVSAPGVVKKAKKHLGLDDAATVLYLELLALPAPTDKFLQGINGWAAKEHAAARAALVSKKLVLEAKRERAGRDVFLPGGWEKRSGPELPFETWKLPLYEALGAPFVAEPIGELYGRAFERVEKGDGPRFEDVSAVRSKAKKK